MRIGKWCLSYSRNKLDFNSIVQRCNTQTRTTLLQWRHLGCCVPKQKQLIRKHGPNPLIKISCTHIPPSTSSDKYGLYTGGSIRYVTTSIAGASPRQMADLEERVASSIGTNVTDPETNMSLQKLGWVHRRLAISDRKNDESKGSNSSKTVQVLLQLPTLLHPSLDELKCMVQREAKKEIAKWLVDNRLANTTDVTAHEPAVNVEALPTQPVPWMVQAGQQTIEEVKARLGPGLTNVSQFLAIYSCKGGVGKSTVAVNLAYELARNGGRVGILDVDIYGPSLPVLIHLKNPAVKRSPLGSNMVYPIIHKGVKMLSLGFVSSMSGVPGSGKSGEAAILRGPMAGRVVTQLLKGTDWGDLDVLILDLPPGTGDVQLTVCQEVDLSFAVGVTTPSKLAVADAKKGISMFASMGIDTIAMVENMAFFECEGGAKHYPFGKGLAGGQTASSELLNKDFVCQLPISEIANEANENGIPICLSRPGGAENELQAFKKLAKIVATEVFRLPFRIPDGEGYVVIEDEKFDLSSIQLDNDNGRPVIRLFSDSGAIQKRIQALALRSRDPKTGEMLEDQSSVSSQKGRSGDFSDSNGMVSLYKAASDKLEIKQRKDLTAERIEKKAKVGFEVTWSDGSRFIYSRRAIALAAGGQILK